MFLLSEVRLTMAVLGLSKVCGHVQIDLATGGRLCRQLRRLSVAHLVEEWLAKACIAMSLHLSLLDGARLHVHLLASELLHLNLVRLVNKRLDGVQLGATASGNSHVGHFWR